MQIWLNGEKKQLNPDCSVAQLLLELGLSGQRLAVELNKIIVPRSRHAEIIIQANDQVEIIHAVGGG